MERQDQIDDGTRALSSKDDDINVSDAAPDPDEDDLDDLDGLYMLIESMLSAC